MMRFLPRPRWRQLRWVACAAVVPALWACTSRKLAPPVGEPAQVVKNRFQQSVNRDLDLLFMIDDSLSMAPLQQKLRDRIPDFMEVLKELPGGLPNLHVAVVSSSLGAGVFGDVSGCKPGTEGNVNGVFQHAVTCTQLAADQSFLIDIATPGGGRMQNFTGGDISPVFSCIANLGDGGCGFEHQFESTRVALQRSLLSNDVNSGFLRPSAYLAIVMLTNEDDCSVPESSMLFDPSQLSVTQPLGGLQSYRCNEFGHLCDQPLPHTVAGLPMTLTNCRSKEDGTLVTVQGFIDFIKGLKASPDQILVAALDGPPTPYTVISQPFAVGNGMENQPAMKHSCPLDMAATTEYADPGVRIKQWLDGFGTNAVLETICAADFKPAMVRIADVIGRALGAQCVTGKIANKVNGDPDCEVTERQYDAAG